VHSHARSPSVGCEVSYPPCPTPPLAPIPPTPPALGDEATQDEKDAAESADRSVVTAYDL
jgi:hypothetical protein